MPLGRSLSGQRRVPVIHEHDDLPAQAALVKLESCLALPIEAEIGIQSHLQRLSTEWWAGFRR
jgi:hypothetical protein